MVFGSLVELHVGLHSCLCFSLFEKLLFFKKKLAQYFLDTLLSVKLLKLFYIAISTASRYLVDRSRKLLPPRQLLDNQWIDRAYVLASDGLFLDTSLIHVFVEDYFLDTFLINCLDTFICRDLVRVYLSSLVQSGPHFVRSLS